MTSSASSQVALRKVESWEPLRPPVRISGCVRRSGLWTSSAIIGAFTQMLPFCTGSSAPLRTAMTRSARTSTESEQFALQNWQALVTVRSGSMAAEPSVKFSSSVPSPVGAGAVAVDPSAASAGAAPTTSAALVSAAPWTNFRLLTGVLLFVTSGSP